MSDSDIEKVYNVFFRPGEVVELRALGCGGKNNAWEGFARHDTGVFGYCNNAKDFVRSAEALDRLAEPPYGIYFTINPPKPAVMARAHNRLVAVNKKRPCTSDKEIRKVRWLPIDIDVSNAVRPTGVSSSAEELKLTRLAGIEIVKFLSEKMGFPDPIKGMSGNGHHVIYRIPEMVPEEAKPLLKKCLAALQDQLTVEHVEVDQKVFNPSRIWKLYGTTARKGDHTNDRPHRQSRLFKDAPKSFDEVPEVPLNKLIALAELAHKDDQSKASHSLPAKSPVNHIEKSYSRNFGKVLLGQYLTAYGVNYRVEQKNGSDWYFLDDGCPFDPQHKGKDAAIIQNQDGKITYYCFHNSCHGLTWKDVRQVISGNDKIVEFCENYDPDWTPTRSCGTGLLTHVKVLSPGPPGKGSLIVEILNAPETVPPPDEIDPYEFFERRGKRHKFCVHKLVAYLATLLRPIVCTSGKFYRYDNGFWQEMADADVRQMIVAALGERVQANWVKEALTLLKDRVRRQDEHWQPYPELVNVRNGMVNIEDGSLLPHDPKYCSRVQLPIDYDPNATAPRLEQFFTEIFPENGEDGTWQTGGMLKMMMLQEFMGYCLMETCKYERCMFMYGQGANGKSTVLNVMEKMLGADHCSDMNIDDLANRFNIPYLQNKLINKSPEALSKEQSAVQKLKSFISGDRVVGEWKHGEQVSFAPRTKFLFAMNLPPNIHDKSHGFNRKILVLNFNRVFEEHEMDRDLAVKLENELDGIFVFALEGAMRLRQQDGFTDGGIIHQDKDMFMGQLNNVLLFVSEECEIEDGARIPSDDLFEAYKAWCDKNGLRALGAPKFQEQLLHKYKIKKVKGCWSERRRMTFNGIRLIKH